MNERRRLHKVARSYWPQGFEGRMVRASAQRLLAYCQGDTCLEVGAGSGEVTRLLSEAFRRVVVVEPAKVYLAAVRELALPNVELVESLIEDHHTDETFDSMVLSHVLEHVESPDQVLPHCMSMLAPGGVMVVIVPNAGSIHRRIGTRLGMLPAIDALSDADLRIGHRRVYQEHTLRADLEKAGLRVDALRGHFCKPLSNSQLDALPDDVQDALLAVGDDLAAEAGSELLAVCRPSNR